MKESLAAGTIISHYRVVSHIGAGGMGEVYLAEDTRLGRKVALKLLSAGFTQDPDRVRRFQQEARAASALNHPNIITIFEIGHLDSSHFIATEFIDGETLRERMSTLMPLREVLEVATQVTTAIAAAHRAGIIHRDIKPENIMLRPDGFVKVLDFGLAKLTEKATEFEAPFSDPEAATRALVSTNPGIVMGTVSYMSPEQARGLRADERTDIFSIGVVLYEMVAGRKPFDGTTISDVIALILGKDPPLLARYSTEAPAELERIVAKALAKDREERYQTAKDLLIDLKRLKQRLDVQAELERSGHSGWDEQTVVSSSGGQAAVTTAISSPMIESGSLRPMSSAEYLISEIKQHKKSIALIVSALVISTAAIVYFATRSIAKPINSVAVLPFASANGDSSAEDMSDSFTESIINSLSRLPGLRVMSFSSVSRYKGQQADPRTVGSELDVRAVLTGRVVQRGDNLTIRIELVNALDNSHIWGQQYTRKFAEALLMQEEISNDISEKLRLRLSGEDRKRVEAHQLYLKGRYHWSKRTPDGLTQGVDYFQQAIDKDPNYALAWAGLADCYNMLVIYSRLSPREGFPKAKEAAVRALDIDESLAEAHTSLAFALFRFDWDWAASEREFNRAIELNPNYAPAHQWYSNFLAAAGRMEEAIAEARRTHELDPLSLITNSHLGWIFYFARQYDQSIERCKKALELDPNFFAARRYMGLAYTQKGMYDEAIAEFEKAVRLAGGSALMKAELANVYGLAGRRGEAQQVLTELTEVSKQRYVSSYLMALIHAGLGDTDRTVEWLERAYDERAEFLVYIKVDPRLDRVRSDSRFDDLVRRMNKVQ
jgi:serine/threonine-protein kinase